MANILIASDFTMKQNRDLKWSPKKWLTRDGNTTVYWTVSDSVPSGFTEDSKYLWRVDGIEAPAFFSPEVLAGWHSLGADSGQLSRKPHILYSKKRELTIHEKLAAADPAPGIIPQPTRRLPATRHESLHQAAKMEVGEVINEYRQWLAAEKASYAAKVNAQQAAVRRDVAEICKSYGVPLFPLDLPR